MCKGIKEPPMMEREKNGRKKLKKRKNKGKEREIFTWNEYTHTHEVQRKNGALLTQNLRCILSW